MMFSEAKEKPFVDLNQGNERNSSAEAIQENDFAVMADSPTQIARGDSMDSIAETEDQDTEWSLANIAAYRRSRWNKRVEESAAPVFIIDFDKKSETERSSVSRPQILANEPVISVTPQLQDFNRLAKITSQEEEFAEDSILDGLFEDLLKMNTDIETKVDSISREESDSSRKIAAIYAQAYPRLQQSLEIIMTTIQAGSLKRSQRTAFYVGAIADYLVDVSFKRINVSDLSEEDQADFHLAYDMYSKERELPRAAINAPACSVIDDNKSIISDMVYLQEIANEASKRSDDFVKLKAP